MKNESYFWKNVKFVNLYFSGKQNFFLEILKKNVFQLKYIFTGKLNGKIKKRFLICLKNPETIFAEMLFLVLNPLE